MTFMQGDPDARLGRFVDYLRKWLPDVRVEELRHFDTTRLRRENQEWLLDRQDLLAGAQARDYLRQLIAEGYEWINIAGSGPGDEGAYLATFEHSLSRGLPVTAINLGGPPLTIGGVIRETPLIRLI